METAIQTTAHPGLSSKETARKLALIEHGARLVISVAQQCGYTCPTDNLLEGKTWSELRDDMYDEMRCHRGAISKSNNLLRCLITAKRRATLSEWPAVLILMYAQGP